MKELTTDEKILIGKSWDAGYGINGIALIVSDKRKDMDMYYLARQIAAELTGRVSIYDQGGD
jgi:1,4-dihydroxy-2-naphthoyl-CoA synthase